GLRAKTHCDRARDRHAGLNVHEQRLGAESASRELQAVAAVGQVSNGVFALRVVVKAAAHAIAEALQFAGGFHCRSRGVLNLKLDLARRVLSSKMPWAQQCCRDEAQAGCPLEPLRNKLDIHDKRISLDRSS